jgi:DNA-directed RNA polymerase specialized sigma subunit
VLETEVNFYGFMGKVESITSKLTGSDAEIFKLNTTRRLSAKEIAKELGISTYKLFKLLDTVLENVVVTE